MNPVKNTPSPDLPEAAAELRTAVFRLARRLRAERAVDALSDGQYIVLATLKIHGPQTLTQLAERERVTAPSMIRTINGLEKSGWLTRTADETDRRKVNISLTDAGRDVVEETVRLRTAWLEAALGELTDPQRALLADAARLMQEVAGR